MGNSPDEEMLNRSLEAYVLWLFTIMFGTDIRGPTGPGARVQLCLLIPIMP